MVVLDPSENNLGFLHPKYVDITETNELGALRSIKITHPLTDDNNEDLTRYNDLLVHGNKVWREKTSDGDSCLYVLLEDKEVDQLENTVSISGEEVATELSMLPPHTFNPVTVDLFEDGAIDTSKWTVNNPVNATITEPNGTLQVAVPSHDASAQANLTDGFTPLTGLPLPTGDFDMTLKINDIANLVTKSMSGLVLVDNISTRAHSFIYAVRDYISNSVTVRDVGGYLNGAEPEVFASLTNTTGPLYIYVQRTGSTYTFSYGTSEGNVSNTLTTTLPFTPSHIAIITQCWSVTGTTNAVTMNYNEATLLDSSKTTVTVNSTLLNTLCGSLFEMGTITPQTVTYNGTIGVLPFLREVESQTGYEFQFRYEYDTDTKKIRRYLDFVEQRGKTHTQPVEIGYNTNNIEYEDTETDTFLGAGPTGAPSDDTSMNIAKFHKARQSFLNLAVNPTVRIPLWVTTDSSGNETLGPLAYPPFAKVKGESFVRCLNSDSAASYKEVQKMQGGGVESARICLFSSTETNKYNLYWDCVEKIKEKNQPNISLSTNVIDIPKLKGNTPEYYNVGDALPVQLPGRTERVNARVTKTVKNPRNIDKDQITIGNYSLNFFADYVNAYLPAKKPYL